MKTKIIVLVLTALVLVVGWLYTSKILSQSEKAEISEWINYENEDYGFEFKHTNAAQLISETSDRISFSTPVKGVDECPHTDCPYSLLPGEYLIRIEFRGCKSWLTNITQKPSNGGVVYNGDVDQGGDNPGVRHTLCAEKDGKSISLTVTANQVNNNLAKDILASFNFRM